MLAMAKNVEPQSEVSVRDLMGTKTDTLRRHVRGHNEEKAKKCNQCDYASAHGGNLRTHLTMHRGEKSNKCNKCDYASSQTDILGLIWNHPVEKSHKQMQPVWQYIFSSRRFEDSFENTQWRKVKQMQSVWKCVFPNRQFENILKNTLWTKVKHVIFVTLHLPKQALWGLIWKLTVEESQTSATSVIKYLLHQAI